MSSKLSEARSAFSPPHKPFHLIDCDVHQTWPDDKVVRGRLPRAFKDASYGSVGTCWASPIGVLRPDAIPPQGGPPGSCLDTMRRQLLDPFEMDYAILTGGGILDLGVHPHIDYAAALARCYNDALVETWLSWDERLLGSIIVTPQNPEAAAAEVRRMGSHPKVVQVLMCSATRIPYGHRSYWPIYKAACEMGLPIAIHPGTECKGIGNMYVAGFPSSYLEWHTNIPQNYMGQLVSLICEGVFEEFPELKFVFIEGGLAWIPGVLWRFEKNWKALRSTVPWVRKTPIEYLRHHVRFTTQPVEEPPEPEQFRQLLQMIDAENTVIFSSDYPHWDNDSPKHAFPSLLPQELREAIFWKNAVKLYQLPKSERRAK